MTLPHISLHNGCDRIHRNERKELERRSGGAGIVYIKGEVPSQKMCEVLAQLHLCHEYCLALSEMQQCLHIFKSFETISSFLKTN